MTNLQPPAHRFRQESSMERKNGRESSSNLLSSHRNIEKQAETIRTNYFKALKSSQMFTATERMLNQEKVNLKTAGQLCDILICPTPVTAQ